jgi:hypothetical protein
MQSRNRLQPEIDTPDRRAVPDQAVLRLAAGDVLLSPQAYKVNRKRIKRLMGLSVIYKTSSTPKPYPEHKIYPYLFWNVPVTRRIRYGGTDIT